MKKIIFVILASALSAHLISCSSKSSKKQDLGRGFVQKGNGSFQLKPYKEVTLENGLKILYVYDDSLPRVSMTLLVKTGSRFEKLRTAGLNALTAYLLEEGTQTRKATQVADELGALGTSLDISPGYDFTTVYADALKTGSLELLDLFSDVVLHPAFNDSEVRRVRSQMQAALKKKIDNPSAFADDKANEFLFGAHPYGRDIKGLPQSLVTIRKQDIIRHYLAHYRPNNAALAVVGNFDAAYEGKVQEKFLQWSKRKQSPPADIPVPAIEKLDVKLIVKKGLQQTQIRISQIGIDRKDPDYLVLRVGNEALGGSFASRLNQKIRDDLGLTYSIYSAFEPRKEKGSFEISTFTKNETAGKTLDETLKVLSEYVDKGPTEKEVSGAKSQMIGQFPRAIETADRLAYNLLALDYYGIPVEYLTEFNDNVEKISLKKVNEAMRRVVRPQKLKVLVYGDASIVPQFEKYKPVIEML